MLLLVMTIQLTTTLMATPNSKLGAMRLLKKHSKVWIILLVPAMATNTLYWLDFSRSFFCKRPLFKAHCTVLPARKQDTIVAVKSNPNVVGDNSVLSVIGNMERMKYF